MNKLPCILAAFFICSDFCLSAEDDAVECRLQSLRREFVIEAEESDIPSWFQCMPPLSLELKLVPPAEKMRILSIAAKDISITDAKGKPLEWICNEMGGSEINRDVAAFEICTNPQGEWVEIKGTLAVQMADDIISHPAQTVTMREKGKLNIAGREITYAWGEDKRLEFSLSERDAWGLAEFSFVLPSGEIVEYISSSCTVGLPVVEFGYRFRDDVKTVSVIVRTYSEPRCVMVPVRMRIGFSGEIKSE